MKPKPLRNKQYFTYVKWLDKDDNGIPIHKSKDIKSAVEWFKNQLKFYPETLQYDLQLLDIINEAFEDVTK